MRYGGKEVTPTEADRLGGCASRAVDEAWSRVTNHCHQRCERSIDQGAARWETSLIRTNQTAHIPYRFS